MCDKFEAEFFSKKFVKIFFVNSEKKSASN